MKQSLKLFSSAILLLALALFWPQTSPTQAQGSSSHTCSVAFEFGVTGGPSTPLTLQGILKMNIQASGAFTGTLEGVDGKLVTKGKANLPRRLSVIGQANGHAINMLIKLPGNQTVFGSGAAEANLSTCNGQIKGVMGGAAVGPKVGDQGDWRSLCPKGYKGPPSEC